jgi:hypothetical protein
MRLALLCIDLAERLLWTGLDLYLHRRIGSVAFVRLRLGAKRLSRFGKRLAL